MFSSLGWGEVAVLLIVALVIFGPDRLPGAAKQAGETLRGLRKQITGARKQVSDEIGVVMPKFDQDLLNPKTFVRKHLWEEDEDEVKPNQAPPAMQAAAVAPAAVRGPAPFDIEAT